MYRAFKSRWLTGALLVLPVLFGTVWYAWSAYAALDRYVRASGTKKDFNRTLYQIALHDELEHDLRRLRLPERPATGRLPTYELYLSTESVDALNQHPVREDDASYVRGSIKKAGEIHDVSVRYRGSAHWNWIGPQKSLKIRLERGELLDDTRVFNLLNDPTPFGLEEQIILAIAREEGLLTPEYYPAWLRINNSDMGVYRYEAQPDEGLLRRNRRMPGSLYSGDADAADSVHGVGSLFFDRKGWTKVAWRTDSQKDEYPEIDRLLAAISKSTYREFATYALDTLALDKYALFDALDVVFGSNDHDYESNHKLYADPYTGRLEPIAWSYRAFHHENAFNLVENPLLLRLLLTPGYSARRDQVAYTLLTGKASVPAVRDRATKLFRELRPELEADPYWDAYKLLPRVSRFTRFMVRPMSTAKWFLASEDDLDDLSRRSRYLLDQLEADDLTARWRYTGQHEGRIDIEVGGHAAHRLDDVVVAADGCAGSFQIRADADLNGALDVESDSLIGSGELGAEAHIASYADLLPGIALEALEGKRPKAGNVRSVPQTRRYTYFVSSAECRPEYLAIILHSMVTGSSLRLDLALTETGPVAGQIARGAPADRVPQLEPGDSSPHPWALAPEPTVEIVDLGPEPLVIDRTRAFGAHQTVRIAPGTHLLLGPGVSLIFFGPVFAEGTLTKPIVLERKDPKQPFGGVALQGPGTSGSRWTNVQMRGGTRPKYSTIEFPAMLNIHATSDITLDGCRLAGAQGSEDVLHGNSITNLRLHELTIRDAPVDALDLEFVDAEIRGLVVVAAGDDCLDLMSAHVRLQDSVLLRCTNNAISAGEETDIAINNALMAESRSGVLAKNASAARLSRSVIYRAGTALRTARREIRYSGASSIRADEVFAVHCQDLRADSGGTRIEGDRFQTSLPGPGELSHLAEVLHLSEWAALDDTIAHLRASDTR